MSSDTAIKRPFTTWTPDQPISRMEWTPLPTVAWTATRTTATAETATAEWWESIIHTSNKSLLVLAFPAAESSEPKEKGAGEDEEAVLSLLESVPFLQKVDQTVLGGALSTVGVEHTEKFETTKPGSTTPLIRIIPVGSTKNNLQTLCLMSMGSPLSSNTKEENKAEEETRKQSLGQARAMGKALAALLTQETWIESCTLVVFTTAMANHAVTQEWASEFTCTCLANLYSDQRFRNKNPKKKGIAEKLNSIRLHFVSDKDEGFTLDRITEGIEQGTKMARAIFLTKDIVSAPHNILNSTSLADTARRIAQAFPDGTLTCEVLGTDEIVELGMNAFLSVARGSETPPQFLHLTYRPTNGVIHKKVGLVGKGVLFDTGGYNIKTQMMELMKFDCGGAAAVLGAAMATASCQLPGVEAHFLVAACENMINEKAYVPSDIVIALNGKSIEVGNTDAEGRLTLADAISYADLKLGCEVIVELSTLTGACLISLGTEIAGLWTAADELGEQLTKASAVTGEKSWRMPLAMEYRPQLDSKIADIKSIGERYGGSIIAALFLSEFVSKGKSFAHLDIAGPVWDFKAANPTGYGVKLIVEWLRLQGISGGNS